MKKITGSDKYLSAGDYLVVVRDYALSKGISLNQLLENSDVAMQDLIHPPELVNNQVVRRIGHNLYNHLGNPVSGAAEFGLRMTAASHGALGLAVQFASNLNESYEILKSFYRTRINSQDVHIEESGGFIRVHLINTMIEQSDMPQVQQFFDIAVLVSIATNTILALDTRGLTGRIDLNINAPEPDSFPYRSLEGVNVAFDQGRLEVCIPLAWKFAPLKAANPEVVKAALQTCELELARVEPLDWLDDVKRVMMQEEGVMPALVDMAKHYFMSTATFKRRLATYDKSYQDLKNSVRLERAIRLMQDADDSIESIAARLGFSDASNFSKAFKGWTGLTPKQYSHQSRTR